MSFAGDFTGGGRPLILFVEDNRADVTLLNHFIEASDFEGRTEWAYDGEEALDYLFKRRRHEKALTPDLVVLDLNLPKLDGREVLKEMRSNPQTENLPVVILTSSMREEDRLVGQAHGVQGFLTKPSDIDGFEKVVTRILTEELRHSRAGDSGGV